MPFLLPQFFLFLLVVFKRFRYLLDDFFFAKIYIFSLISLLCLFIPHMPLTLRSTLSHCFSFSSCFSRTDTITDYCMHSDSGDGERDLLSFFIMSIGWKWWALWILWTQFCFIHFFSPTCSPKHTWFQSYFSTLPLVRSHKM